MAYMTIQTSQRRV